MFKGHSVSKKISEKNKDKIVVPHNKRPICKTTGCKNKTQHLGTYKANGYPNFRKYCVPCHNERRDHFQKQAESVDRRSLPKCEIPTCKKKVEVFGSDHKGVLKYTVFCKDHVGSINTYLIFRKNYCENIDERLGFKCTTTIFWQGMLDVDHIDGNSDNNDPKNLQTLCKCCHAYKTNKYGDYKTPGRKKLKEAKKNGLLTRLV